MKSGNDRSEEKIILDALAHLGKSVDTMQDLLAQLEELLHARRNSPTDDKAPALNTDIPEDRTVH